MSRQRSFLEPPPEFGIVLQSFRINADLLAGLAHLSAPNVVQIPFQGLCLAISGVHPINPELAPGFRIFEDLFYLFLLRGRKELPANDNVNDKKNDCRNNQEFHDEILSCSSEKTIAYGYSKSQILFQN